MKNYVGHEYYFDAGFLGLTGMLGGIVIEDGDISGNYKGHFLMSGVTTGNIWISKGILTHKKTREIIK